MPKKSREKGLRGEREVVKILQEAVYKLHLKPEVTRNLQQYIKSGCDISGLPGFAIEVKRAERLRINGWWKQAYVQADKNRIPVLFFRQNNKPWRVLIPDEQDKTDYIEKTLTDFLNWFEIKLLQIFDGK